MSGLIPVAGRTMALDIRQLIGVYKLDGHRCVLLDCGYIDIRDTIETLLAGAGLSVVGVLGTHTHFDHFGNGAYFQKHHGAQIALPLGEAELCRTFPTLKGYLFVYSAGEVMSDPQLREMPCYADRVIRPEEDRSISAARGSGSCTRPATRRITSASSPPTASCTPATR